MSKSRAYKEFERQQSLNREEYEKAGMTEAQIQSMYEFDCQIFHSDLRYARHTQSIEPELEPGDHADWANPLAKCYLESVSARLDSEPFCWTDWMDEFEDDEIYEKLKHLTDKDQTIVALYAMFGATEKEIGLIFGISQKAISKRIEKIRKIFEA